VVAVLNRNAELTFLFNVMDYGATGDGSTDDTTAVQDTIDAAAASGGIVFFPSGTYIVNGISVPTQIVLEGVNGLELSPETPTSRLKLKAGSSNHLIVPDGQTTGVQIRDLLLDTNSIAKAAIYLADAAVAEWWVIERCMIVNSGYTIGNPGDHVYIGNSNIACTMRSCQLFSNSAGTHTQHYAGCNGISWYGADGTLEDTFIGCYSNVGLVTLGGTSDITLKVDGGGSFWNDIGIVVAGHGAVITNYSVDHNYNDGIYAGYPFKISESNFHSNSLQTSNSWSHIRVDNSLGTTSVTNCRQSPQSGDAGANICAYFVNANAASTLILHGNHQHASATLGTSWSNYPYPGATYSTDLSSPTALTGDGNTHTLVTSASLPKGSYMVIATLTTQGVNGGGASYVDWGVATGTAVGSFVGTVAGGYSQPAAASINLVATNTLVTYLTVTTAGTIVLRYSLDATGVTALSNGINDDLGHTTGLTAIRQYVSI
jgi:hypothetical protein